LVSIRQFFQEHVGVENDDGNGRQSKAPKRARGVA
jgi:hypothetical protein